MRSRQRLALDQLQHECRRAVAISRARRSQRCSDGSARRAPAPRARSGRAPLGSDAERCRQNLDRHVAIELRVARAIDLAHPAAAEPRHHDVNAPMLRPGSRRIAGSASPSSTSSPPVFRRSTAKPSSGPSERSCARSASTSRRTSGCACARSSATRSDEEEHAALNNSSTSRQCSRVMRQEASGAGAAGELAMQPGAREPPIALDGGG